jgi:hypothetical protein
VVVRKFVAALAVSTALVLGTSGCSITHDIPTLQSYAPSDGAEGVTDGVKALNVIYLTKTVQSGYAGDEFGGIIGSFVNTTDKPVTIHLQYTEDTSPATDVIAAQKAEWVSPEIAPGAKYDLGYNENSALSGILLNAENKPVLPGSVVSVWFAVNNGAGVELRVPALDGSLDQYAGILDNLANANGTPGA